MAARAWSKLPNVPASGPWSWRSGAYWIRKSVTRDRITRRVRVSWIVYRSIVQPDRGSGVGEYVDTFPRLRDAKRGAERDADRRLERACAPASKSQRGPRATAGHPDPAAAGERAAARDNLEPWGVWCVRSGMSVFGSAAAWLRNEDGLERFTTEEAARERCREIMAGLSSGNVHYSPRRLA